MIVEALLSIIFGIISMVLSIIDLPNLPDEAVAALDILFDRLPEIFDILFFFVNPTLLLLLLGLVLVYHNVAHTYDFIIWVLNKFGIN